MPGEGQVFLGRWLTVSHVGWGVILKEGGRPYESMTSGQRKA